MQELIGQTLGGRYQLQSLLGAGGMGGVFKARDLTLQRIVALKVMRPEYAQQTNFRQRFLQEAQAAARLEHNGVVKVHDFHQAGPLLYIVMEFVPGPTLQDRLAELTARKQSMPLSEAILLVRQLALALAYVHEQGVLHRDLKPANIILKPQTLADVNKSLPYQPVITDLGLAKLEEGGIETRTGMSVGGTPAYMSPEQAKGEPVDSRSDVYSLGVLLYELAVGQRPFPIKTLTDAVHYHVFRKPPPPQSVRPDLPTSLATIILRTLEKEPSRRFPSAAALAQALDGLLGQASPPLRQPQRRRWLALLLVPLFGLIVWLFARSLSGPGTTGNPPTATLTNSAKVVVTQSTPTLAAQNGVSATPTRTSLANGQPPVKQATNTATPTPTLSPTPTTPPTAAATATPQPPTATFTPPPTVTPRPTPTATPSLPVLKAPNARPTGNGLFIAPRVGADAGVSIAIDGNPADWDALRAAQDVRLTPMLAQYNNPKGQGCAARYPGAPATAVDLAGAVLFAYDAANLYVSFMIDDEGYVSNPDPTFYWRGDAPQLLLDMNLPKDFYTTSNSADEFQIDLSPGQVEVGNSPAANLFHVDYDHAQLFTEAQVAATKTATGYFLEAALPWARLNGFQPKPSLTLGVAPGVSDNDTPGTQVQECMLFAAPKRKWGNPTTWGTLVLQ